MDAQKDLIQRAVAAIQQAWNEGCPVAGHAEELAPIAVRRWCSSSRRGIDQANVESRIEDLAKGLIAHCESNPNLVGPLKADYLYLAERIVAKLELAREST